MSSDFCLYIHNKSILHKHFFLSLLNTLHLISRSWLISISIPLKNTWDPKKTKHEIVFSALLAFTKNVSFFLITKVSITSSGYFRKKKKEIQMTHNANIQSQNFEYISIFMLIYMFLETTTTKNHQIRY